MGRLRTLTSRTLDLLFPPTCLLCHGEVSRDGTSQLCQECGSILRPTRQSACPRCALSCPAVLVAEEGCHRCRHKRFYFDGVWSLGVYRADLREVVLRLKRPDGEALASYVGAKLAGYVNGQKTFQKPDFVLSVPMFWLRRALRGTNASSSIASAVAASLHVPYREKMLKCCRYKKKQGTLRPSGRRKNVRGAFRLAKGYDIKGSRALLVDDVMTTGATANELSKVLKESGVRQVCVVVVARGSGSQSYI